MSLFLLLVGVASALLPSPPAGAACRDLELVRTPSAGVQSFEVVLELAARPPTREVYEVLADTGAYPLDETFWGQAVLTRSDPLLKCANAGATLQRTGSARWLGIRARAYVSYLELRVLTDERLEMEWHAVSHACEDGTCAAGPFAEQLVPYLTEGDVYPPYTHGTWGYEPATGLLRYRMDADPGGRLSGLQLCGAVRALPARIARDHWGLAARPTCEEVTGSPFDP